jgi:hypothetical protein
MKQSSMILTTTHRHGEESGKRLFHGIKGFVSTVKKVSEDQATL